MRKKLMALILGAVISLQGICSGGVVINADDNNISSVDRVVQLEYDESAELAEIELFEGEQVQLDFQLDPELYDLEDIRFYSSRKYAIVSHTGKLVGFKSGEDKIAVYVRNKNDNVELEFDFFVNILPNDTISAENRNELNRLNDFKYDDYRRRKMELLGVADENAPRLTIDKIQEFIDNSENYIDIIKKVNNYIEYPDHVSSKGHESYSYWSDPKGNEIISIGYDRNYIGYTKTADDGTVIGAQILYPEKEEFYENGKDKNQEYMQYNQISPVVDGVLYIEDYSYNDEPMQVELYEGEQIQLKFSDKFDLNDKQHIRFSSTDFIAAVTQDLRLIGCKAGIGRVSIYFGYDWIELKVNVKTNENISAENRAELDRINALGDGGNNYIRRRMELLGVIEEDAPRLDMEKVEEIINTYDSFEEIIKHCDLYHGYPDLVPLGESTTKYMYWFDEKGNEQIIFSIEGELIYYTKVADNGTVIGNQILYPEKEEFYEYNDSRYKDYYYMEYNQINPEGYGTLVLDFIDESTGEPFTETNGTFQLMAKPLEGDGDEIEFKSWKTTADSTIIIEEMPRDLFYTLVYTDEYHTDEQGRLYKYEIDTHKQTHKYSFYYQDYYNFNVYLKRHYSTDPQKVTMGDVNMDNQLTIADVVVLQNWLLGKSDASLKYWWLADFCDDDMLDIFDLCLMKKELIKAS